MNVLQNNRQESILIVDDDPEVSRVVSDMLHLEGYSTAVTDSPARALSFLHPYQVRPARNREK